MKFELVAESVGDGAGESPLRLIRRALRGRWPQALVLGALLATLGGLIGYRAAPPTYESTGLVRVEAAQPAILYETPETRAPSLFSAYVAAQTTYLRSREILDAAVAQPAMRETGWPGGSAGVAELQNALTVRHKRGEQIITVAVTHKDPFLAQTAVNAVLAAYQQSRDEHVGLSAAAREQVLQQREAELTEELEALRREILDASNQYGPEAIEQMHAMKVEELIAVDQKLAELRLAGMGLGAEQDGRVPGTPFTAANTVTLSKLADEELDLMAEIQSLQGQYGQHHPMIRELNRRLEAVRIRIDLHERSAADLGGRAGGTMLDGTALADASEARLRNLEARFETERSLIREDAARLGQWRIALRGMNERAEEVGRRLAQTRQRLDEMAVEANREDFSRVNVIALGDMPVAPVADRRRGLAGAGALLGLLLGGGLVFLIGLVEGRVRFVEQLELLDLPAPTIGLLPDVSIGGQESREQSARSVHQLRNLLELEARQPEEKVIAITSCERGEGKTSLAMALGISFAAAGRRTLLIDADVAQHTLTNEVGLGEVPGLCEAIGPGGGSGQAHATQRANLWAMPIGAAEGMDAADLSRSRLTWLLDALRSQFDTIVIDTGEILTSVEACLVSAVADRVVTVVGREQKASLIRRSLARLRQVGATSAGIVFNKAPASEFEHQADAWRGHTKAAARLVPGQGQRLEPLGQVIGETAGESIARKKAA